MNCKNCGNTTKYKSGTKNGRAWAGYFCQNPQCKSVEWDVSKTQFVKTGGAIKTKEEPDWEAIRNAKAEGLAKGASFNKAVDIVIALYQSKDITAEIIIPKIKELFEELKQINENGKPRE